MDLFRVITIVLSLTALIAWVIWLLNNPGKWGYTVGVFMFVGSVLIFNLLLSYLQLTDGYIDVEFFNHWSHVNYWLILFNVIGAAVTLRINGRHRYE